MKNKLFFLFILIAACSKNSSHHSIAVPDLIQAEKTRGNISGRILLYDGENIAATDNSGITVSIDNTTVTTQTGADGRWTLDSIPKGTYDISYSKPGYGTGKIMGVIIVFDIKGMISSFMNGLKAVARAFKSSAQSVCMTHVCRTMPLIISHQHPTRLSGRRRLLRKNRERQKAGNQK